MFLLQWSRDKTMSAKCQFRPGEVAPPISHHLSLPIASLMLALASNAPAQGTLTLDGGSVSPIDDSGVVNFMLQFNRVPDFFAADDYGRQADAFQFYIASSTNIPMFYPPRPYRSLLRGGEIQYGNGISIRNDGPPDDSDPHSGGWGSLRGSVPFNLTGQTLTFSVAAAILNVQGPFAYSLLLTSFGAQTHDPYTGESGRPIAVPEPACLSLALLAIAGGFLLRKRGSVDDGG
jgi:hypothetical protein